MVGVLPLALCDAKGIPWDVGAFHRDQTRLEELWM